MTTEAEIAELGCIVCHRKGYGYSPAEVHHIRHGAGMGQKSMVMIPLCPMHHRLGGYGVAFHAGPAAWQANFGLEIELAQAVERLLR